MSEQHERATRQVSGVDGAGKGAAAEWVAIDKLRPWVKNPRRNDPAVKAVADSIRRFGFGSPIIARRENDEVIAGHTRIKAAIKLGLAEVPVRYLDLTEAEAHALALADNKVSEIAEWDNAALAEILREMAEDSVDIASLGWSDEELRALIDGEDAVSPTDAPDQSGDLVESFQVLITCKSEDEQASLLERLYSEGYECRALVS